MGAKLSSPIQTYSSDASHGLVVVHLQAVGSDHFSGSAHGVATHPPGTSGTPGARGAASSSRGRFSSRGLLQGAPGWGGKFGGWLSQQVISISPFHTEQRRARNAKVCAAVAALVTIPPCLLPVLTHTRLSPRPSIEWGGARALLPTPHCVALLASPDPPLPSVPSGAAREL